MAFEEIDVRGAFLVCGALFMFNRLCGEWYWEDEAMGITPEVVQYSSRWGKK